MLRPGHQHYVLGQAGFQIVGIDISETAVAQARTKAREAGVGIRFWVGSALDLPFERDEFDCMFYRGCFHHMKPPDRNRLIADILRVLKDSGHRFMVRFSANNGPGWNHFSDEGFSISSPRTSSLSRCGSYHSLKPTAASDSSTPLCPGPIDVSSAAPRHDHLAVCPSRELMPKSTRHRLACITYL